MLSLTSPINLLLPLGALLQLAAIYIIQKQARVDSTQTLNKYLPKPAFGVLYWRGDNWTVYKVVFRSKYWPSKVEIRRKLILVRFLIVLGNAINVIWFVSFLAMMAGGPFHP